MAQKKPQKILITGANGFIGSRLLQHYKSQGIAVIGVDLTGNQEDIFQGDIGQPESISHLLADCEVVIHTAALVSNAIADADMWRVNVLATHNLVEAAKKHHIKRFVQISSIVAYGNTATGELDENHPVHADGGSYVLTKLASEHAVLAATANSAMELVIIRPGDVYGPGSRPWVVLPLEAINKGQFMLPAKGEGFFRPIYIDDLIRGIALATTSQQAAGEIINLSCEGYITTAQFFSYHYRWLNKRGPLKVPTSLALFAAATASKIAGVTGGVNEASTATVRQLSTNSWFSIAKAERLLGWKPEVSLNTGMQASQEWAKSQGLIN
jgi:nucleoside-diphosphate-sugar epimerase